MKWYNEQVFGPFYYIIIGTISLNEFIECLNKVTILKTILNTPKDNSVLNQVFFLQLYSNFTNAISGEQKICFTSMTAV